VVGLLLCFAALSLDFWSGFFPIRSCNDPWWHLKTGKVLAEYMGEHGLAFPPTDVFTLTGGNVPWVNHEWLADLGLYGLYALGGLQLCIVVKSLILAAVGLVIILTLRGEGCGLGWGAVGGLFAILVGQTTLYLRPPILTYLFLVVFVWVLRQFPRRPRQFTVLLVALEVLWVNLHGGAVLGVLLCGFYLVERLWIWLAVRWGIETAEQPFLGGALCCFALVCLASLVNPWGYEIHLLPGKVLGDDWLVSRLGELAPPDLRRAVGLSFLLCGFLLVPFLKGPSIGLFRTLTLLFFGYQAFLYMRQIPLFGLVAVPVLVERLDASNRWLADQLRSARPAVARRLGIIISETGALFLFVFVGYFVGYNPPRVQGLWLSNWRDLPLLVEYGYRPASFPEGAVNFLLYHKIPGPIMHNDNFAGYLIWRLSPEIMPVFTDTRFDLFGSRYVKEERAVVEVRDEPEGWYTDKGWLQAPESDQRDPEFWRHVADAGADPEVTAWYRSGKPYWKWILEKYNINIIMVYCTYDPIDPYLRSGDRGWKPIYSRRQEGYEIYLADRPENQPIFERLGIK
jgi:hypothetical protein